MRNNPVTGYLRFGPATARSRRGCASCRRTAFLLAGRRRRRHDAALLRRTARARCPACSAATTRRDRGAYDRAHEFPFSYRELIPYYEWVEHTLPVQTAAMGTKERAFLRGAQRIGLPVQTLKDIDPGVVPAAGERDPPAARHRRAHRATRRKLRYPQARGCTFCGHCVQGCFEPRGAPRNLAAKRSTDNSYVPMALTADAWQPRRQGRSR